MDFMGFFDQCRLCPRSCGVDRRNTSHTGDLGLCGETDQLRVAYVGPHFGEEPPITGKAGSGTVFFAGCSLKCSYCQNHQISHQGLGRRITTEGLYKELEALIQEQGVHNINLVTPDHFFPHVFHLVSLLRARGYDLPVIYNLSGYQSVDLLKQAQDYVDVYLPDFKYSDRNLAAMLSSCPDYPRKALEAVSEMVHQKGFFRVRSEGLSLAEKGVLVRHLILPGMVDNSLNVLTNLFLEFGPGLPLSLMSQYHPVGNHPVKELNRFVSKEEFDRVYDHAMDLGFDDLFVQYPEESERGLQAGTGFLPDFERAHPFMPE